MKQLQNTLYILTPETYLFLQNETIAVKVGGVEKVRIPSHTISSIYCFGNVTVSTPLIGFCGEHGISLVFLSEYGRFYGRVQGPFPVTFCCGGGNLQHWKILHSGPSWCEAFCWESWPTASCFSCASAGSVRGERQKLPLLLSG